MVISAGAERAGDLSFGLLGPLEVTRRGAQVAVRGPQRRSLLAMLLLRPDQVISVERLIEDLWSGRPPSQARSTLQSHVSHLRRDLDLGHGGLVARSPGYLIAVEPTATDVGRFEHAVGVALGLSSARRIADELTSALALWRGPALAEFASASWAQPEIARLEARRAHAADSLAQANLALGRHDAVLVDLEQLISSEPMREGRWILLMAALQRSGRHVEAVRAAHRYRMTLREAGLEPSPAFERVEQAVLNHEPVDLPELNARVIRLVPTEPTVVYSTVEIEAPRPPPLVGRRAELATLSAALETARAGRPGLVFVSGEPGVGKSRLVHEVVDMARSLGAIALGGSCDDGLAVPYQPFVEALIGFAEGEAADPQRMESRLGARPEDLARLVPDILRVLPHLVPPAGDPDIERYHLFEAVRSWLATIAADRPVLLVLEDLHWATRPTLLLLRHLLRSLKTERLCILATCRGTDVEPRSDRESLLIDITRDAKSITLALPGLDEDEVGELIDHWHDGGGEHAAAGDDFPAILSAATAGNPFFVVEILRHLAETQRASGGHRAVDMASGRVPFPPSLHEVVRQRLGRLSPDTEGVLIRAAILGQEFPVRVLLEMTTLDGGAVAEALERARRAGFIEPVADSNLRYRFCHAVVREVLVAGLPDVQRAFLHRDAGIALESLAGRHDDTVVVELAQHFSAAAGVGEAARAVRYSRRAGDQALARHAADEAAMHYGSALAHYDDCPDGDEHDRCDLLIDLGEAQRRLPDPGYRETFLRAARAAVELGNQEHLARAAKGIARGFLLADVADEERIEVIEQAVASYGDRLSATRARLLASLAGELRLARRDRTSEEKMEKAVAIARQVGDVETMAETQLMQWDLLWHPSTLEARRTMEARLVDYLPGLADPLVKARIAAVSFGRALEAGQGQLARDRFAEVERYAAEAGGPYMAWLVPHMRSVLAVVAGRLDDAERFGMAAAHASQTDHRSGVDMAVLGHLVQISRLRGRLATWEPLIVPVADWMPAARALLVEAWCEMGRLDDAAGTLEQLMTEGEVLFPRDVTWAIGMVSLAHACERLGAADYAAQLAELLVPYREQFLASWLWCLGPVSSVLGTLASARQDLDEADRWFADAERRSAAVPSPFFLERARAARARLRSQHRSTA